MIEFIAFLISAFFILSLCKPRYICNRRLRLAEILTKYRAEYDMRQESKKKKQTNEQNT